MTQLFFLLSGEHETLPFAELKATLEAECIDYRELERLSQVIRLDSDIGAVEAIKRRTAMTRACCQELFHCPTSYSEIVRNMQTLSTEKLLQPNETFAVRIRRIGEASRGLARARLEGRLGAIILNKIGSAKVDLQQPQKTFFGVITDDRYIFGLKLADVSPSPFMLRRPRKRPFFHPSAMSAKLARCMVNLAKPRKGDLLLDPFCGTGSFLVEAGLVGCRIAGFDAKKRMVKGSLRNLRFFNVQFEGIGISDARYLPISRVDCIVTDPPYGRSASTMGYATKEIIQDFLATASDTIQKGKRICFAAPKTIGINEIARSSGLRHLQSHFVYVHRSLTREIAVLEKR